MANFFLAGWIDLGQTGLSFWSLVAVGFLLGLRHATEADHVVAVSTIVSEYRNPLAAAAVGGLWGIGHTFSIIAVGMFVLGLRIALPERAAGWLEFGIAVMIVVLGVRAVRAARVPHDHSPVESTPRNLTGLAKFGIRPLLVGLAHGLAGSAALTLAVLSQIRGFGTGMFYLAAFGFGTVVGMMVASGCVGVPFAIAGRSNPQIARGIRMAAGLAGIGFGIWYGLGCLPL
jgi:high-affinity nickel-transport protein